MTVRRVRGATVGVATALVAGLVLVPVTGANGAGASNGPSFQRVSADPITGSDARVARAVVRSPGSVVGAASARVAVSKKIQILQVWTGLQGAGSNGLSVAAGPRQVVQATGLSIRAFVKSTGATPKGGNKTLLQFFKLSSPVAVSQPDVVYDPVGKRFVAVAVADNSGDIGVVMRISKGTAAAPLKGKKWLPPVEFAFSTSTIEEPGRIDVDESKPLVGVTSDKIVVTTVADDPNDAAVANRVFLFPKAPYYAGDDSFGGWAASVNSTYDGQAPAVNETKQANAFVAIPDTDDVTVTTYTGAAKDKAPQFSKNVVFPANPLNPPTPVTQTGGNTLDPGDLAFTGVDWRSNKLYAAATVNASGRNAVRVFGINTGSGVSLASDNTRKSSTADWFSPDLAIDGAGNVLVVANDEGTVDGPSLAVFARKGSKWLAPRFIAKASGVAFPGGGTTDWWNSTGAALDPRSPWDVWVSGAVGDSGVPVTGLSSRVARVSVAKNAASVKTSASAVNRGARVKFTAKLTRPGGDTIRGLPVALQRKPVNGGKWTTVGSKKTKANGTATWTLRVQQAGLYRTLGKGVSQSGGQGVGFDKVASPSKRVRLR